MPMFSERLTTVFNAWVKLVEIYMCLWRALGEKYHLKNKKVLLVPLHLDKGANAGAPIVSLLAFSIWNRNLNTLLL